MDKDIERLLLLKFQNYFIPALNQAEFNIQLNIHIYKISFKDFSKIENFNFQRLLKELLVINSCLLSSASACLSQADCIIRGICRRNIYLLWIPMIEISDCTIRRIWRGNIYRIPVIETSGLLRQFYFWTVLKHEFISVNAPFHDFMSSV